MTKHEKSRILLLSGVALAAIILLSAGLSGVELIPGQPFPIAIEPLPEGGEMEPVLGGESLLILLRVFFTLVLVGLPFTIIYFIVSPEFRNRVLQSLIPLVLIYMLYIAFTRVPPDSFSLDGAMLSEMFPSQDSPPGPAADFSANSPPWFTLVVVFGLAVLVTALFVGIGWYVWRRRRPPDPSSLEQLAQGAQDALESLQAGGDMKNVVLRCYFDMVQVLDDRRDIQRQSDVTPREFERRLEKAGLPGEHVRPLTRLFEAVRYGAKTLGEDEERQAIACLTAIVAACGEAS